MVPFFSSTPASADTVRVGAGQTLSSLAAEYGTTVDALAATNGITNPNLIYAGAVLQLPSTAAAGTVVVRAGETLTEIAHQYATTVGALAAANDITNLNLIYARRVLALPGSASSNAASTAATVVVSPGETLIAIANRYGTTVSAIAVANDISDPNNVYAGARLVMPTSSMALAAYSAPASGHSGELPAILLAHPSRLSLFGDFSAAAATYGVPANLLEALCWWESGWQSTVLSVTGAVGVCQIEPSTAAFVDDVLHRGSLDMYKSSDNISIAAAYLQDLLQHTGGSDSVAVAAYYQGLLSVETQGMLPTTRNYVKGILAYASIFASAS